VSGTERFWITETDSLLLIRWGLGLSFVRTDGRWGHCLGAVPVPFGAPDLTGCALEWDPDRDDPERVVSPVFQELQLQRDGEGRPHILLLGMAGTHHFSAAFVCDESDGVSRISVDVADRCRVAGARFLASTYTLMLDSGQLAATDDSSIAWNLGPGRLVLAAGPGTRLAMAEAGRRAMRVQALPEIGVAGATRRWQYSWSLSPSQA
jgi:hypothetical protein